MRLSTALRLLIGSLGLIVSAACTRHAAPPVFPQPEQEQVLGLQYRPDEPVTFAISQVLFSISQDLSSRLSIKLVQGQGGAQSYFRVNPDGVADMEAFAGPGTALWLDGQRIRVDEGLLKLGSKAYGSVKAGDRARMESKGLFVNDERRGDL